MERRVTDDEFLIPWSEIQRFEFKNGFLFNKGILVFVNHPERFVRGNYATIQKQREKIKAKGTYLTISIGFIEQSEGEMLALLNNYLDVIQNKRGAVVFPMI